MNGDSEIDPKQMAIAALFLEFKAGRLTGKVEMDFKHGDLVGARKQVVVFA